MLIFLYTKDEITFDQFHENKENLYQLTSKSVEPDGKVSQWAVASMIQGPTFKEEIPEIEACVRIQERDYVVKKGNETIYDFVSFADKNIFSVFSFPLIQGDPKTALNDIHSIVITEEIAKKYFGNNDVMGKTMEVQMEDKFVPFIVSGLAKNTPENSSIKFKMLISFQYREENGPDTHWLNFGFPTYFKLNSKANIKAVEAKMAKVFASKAGNEIEEEKKHGFDAKVIFGIEKFTTMHLNTTFEAIPYSSNPIYSYILSGIALFILIIACINFVNLTVSHSLRRAKEIGIRKVIGGERKQLILQFLGESFLLTFIAFILAFLLATMVIPYFNDWTNKQLSISYLIDYQLIIVGITLFLVTVLAAGFYPALVLSGFNPIETLYNRFRFSGKNYLSKGLIVLQFSLATFMIISTFFIYKQFNFLTNKSLGYNDKNLLVLSVGQDGNRKLMEVYKNELSKIPGIEAVAKRQNGGWGTLSKANQKEIPVEFEHVDESYLPTLQIPLIAGRNFSKDFPTDSTDSVLINEAYAKAAGWNNGTEAVGKTVDFFNGQEKKLQIVGVVKDYHFNSVKVKIEPEIFTENPRMPFGRFLIRINPHQKQEIIRAIEKIYHQLSPFRPFKYDFVEDLNYKNYESEAKWKQIIGVSAILMILISCIGLFGLTLLSIQKRTKEIGIRKVLGASLFQISSMVTKNYFFLLIIAFLIAIPTAWFAIQKWLENFAYKIAIEWQTFALAAFSILLLAVITTSYQAIKAAMANPVKSLRTE